MGLLSKYSLELFENYNYMNEHASYTVAYHIMYPSKQRIPWLYMY